MKHLRTEVRLRHPTQYRFCARRLHVSPRQTSSTLAVNACRAAKTTSQCPIRLDLTFQHPGVHGVFEPLEFAYSLWGRSETARRRTHRPARSRKPLPDGLSFADHGSEAKRLRDHPGKTCNLRCLVVSNPFRHKSRQPYSNHAACWQSR
jgi:hypothetical protein